MKDSIFFSFTVAFLERGAGAAVAAPAPGSQANN